jgi:hypothetical protein
MDAYCDDCSWARCDTSYSTCPNKPPREGRGHPEYLKLLEDLRELHFSKSGGYGTGKDVFANFTAVAGATGQPRYLYAVHRSIEKLTRVLSLHAQGRSGELEEEFMDVAGLMVCAAAMAREDS